MTDSPFVVLTDPAFRGEPRQIAAALSERNIPFRFHTSAYFGRRSLLSRFVTRMPLRVRIEELLLRRFEPLIDERAVRNWIVPDIIRRIARWLRISNDRALPAVDRWFDGVVATCVPQRAEVVLAMQGSALKTFRHARAQGAQTILIANTPDPIVEADMIQAEEARLGLRKAPDQIPSIMRRGLRVRAELAEADLVIANSDFTRRDLIANGVDPAKIVTVGLGVDSGKFYSVSGHRQPSGTARVLFVGSVHARKGVIYLGEAVKELRERGIDVAVRAIGLVDHQYRNVLKPFIESGALELAGPVSHHRLVEEYALADVFVLPTLSDGYGMVVLEAMACGLPVIVTDRCGAPVADGENALVVPHSDHLALAAALMKVLTEPQLAESLRANALRTAAENSWSHYRERVAAIVMDMGEEARERQTVRSAGLRRATLGGIDR